MGWIYGPWRVLQPMELTGNTDYITEQGTSGIWTYRKWHSGIVECWADTTLSPTSYTQSGSTYYTEVITLQLPLTFRPMTVSGICGMLHWIVNPTRGNGSIGIRLARGAAATNPTVDVMLYVMGK